MSTPNSASAALFMYRRSGRDLQELGVNLKESTREIKVDALTASLIARLTELPADFIMSVFRDVSVKEAEAVADESLKYRGFRRTTYLDGYARRRNRLVAADARQAAYEATRRPMGGLAGVVA